MKPTVIKLTNMHYRLHVSKKQLDEAGISASAFADKLGNDTEIKVEGFELQNITYFEYDIPVNETIVCYKIKTNNIIILPVGILKKLNRILLDSYKN